MSGTKLLKTLIQSFGISFLVVAILVSLTKAAKADEAATDLRPAWVSSPYQLPPNAALLYSNQDPSYLTHSFGTHLINPKRSSELQQDYNDRNRDYDMRTSYGIATQQDEINHEQSMRDMSHTVLSAARNGQTQQYSNNVNQAQQNGQISQPIVAMGGVAAVGMGTPVKFKISDGTKGQWSGDAMQRHGTLDVDSRNIDTVAKVEVDGTAGAAERYRVTVTKPVALNIGSSVVYGGSSNTVSASLSRPIIDHLSGSVGASAPANDNNPTGAVPQLTAGVSYGLTF